MGTRVVRVVVAIVACHAAMRAQAEPQVVVVRDAATLGRAIKADKPGWRIQLTPGKYSVRLTIILCA